MQRHPPKSIKEELSKHVCYVLITCDSPSKKGNMSVQMSYGGDPMLAALLLEGASNAMENEVENTHEKCDFLEEVLFEQV